MSDAPPPQSEVEQQRLFDLNHLQNLPKPWSPDGKCLYCGIREIAKGVALCGECETRMERLHQKYPGVTVLKRVQEKIAGGMTKLGDVKRPTYRPPHNSE